MNIYYGQDYLIIYFKLFLQIPMEFDKANEYCKVN